MFNSSKGLDLHNERFQEDPEDAVWGSARDMTPELREEKKVYSLIMREFHNFN